MPDSPQQPFVVVGGGLAGGKAVEELRSAGYDGPLVLIAAESHLPYERPPLSKDYLAGSAERDSVFVNPQQWYDDHDVQLHLGDPVVSLDASAHEVTTQSGQRIGYTKLLLATGSTPRRFPTPGLDDAHAERVLYLRTLDDSDRLREWLRPGVHLVIVGGGWIGLESAAAARNAGADVTVLEMDPLPLQRILGTEVATVFAHRHQEHGVDLRANVSVQAITAAGDGLRVSLADGESIDADVVLVGIGILPNTELAEAAGLEVDNGIVVDGQMRTSDPDVFAVGDVANAFYTAMGQHLRVEHWATALNQPAVAAQAMLGGDGTFDLLPYFYTDQYDLSAEYTGHVPAGGQDDVVLRPGDDGSYLALWLDGRRVRAGMSINSSQFSVVEPLVRSGSDVDPAALADPATALPDVAAAASE